MKTQAKTLVVTATLILALAGMSQEAWATAIPGTGIINVDLNWSTPYVGNSPVESGTPVWNYPAGLNSSVVLASSDGVTTAVTGNIWGNSWVGGPNALFQDFSYVQGGEAQMQLINLDTACTYDLYMYGSGDNTDYVFDGVTKTIIFNTGSSTWNPGPPTGSWVEGENYVVFKGIVPTASGEIWLAYKPGPSSVSGTISGFTLVENVPEPATMALLAVGGVAVVIRRRK